MTVLTPPELQIVAALRAGNYDRAIHLVKELKTGARRKRPARRPAWHEDLGGPAGQAWLDRMRIGARASRYERRYPQVSKTERRAAISIKYAISEDSAKAYQDEYETMRDALGREFNIVVGSK